MRDSSMDVSGGMVARRRISHKGLPRLALPPPFDWQCENRAGPVRAHLPPALIASRDPSSSSPGPYNPRSLMPPLTLTVNGETVTRDVDAAMPLLYLLSDELALRGPKFGCGLAQCGSCTAIVDGKATRTCVTLVGALRGAQVVTLEGLGTIERPHPLQQAFIDEQATQCGFCLSGVILTAKAFLDATPKATDAQIRVALSTVLCRCGGNSRMLRAIRRYADGRVTA